MLTCFHCGTTDETAQCDDDDDVDDGYYFSSYHIVSVFIIMFLNDTLIFRT